MFVTGTANTGEFYAIYRTCISYRKGEISGIMLRGVFCAHKPYFLMPGHNFKKPALPRYWTCAMGAIT